MQTLETKKLHRQLCSHLVRFRDAFYREHFRNARHHKRTQKKFKAQMNVLEKSASNQMKHRFVSRPFAAMNMPKTATALTVNP